jgi:hypothetical protein
MKTISLLFTLIVSTITLFAQSEQPELNGALGLTFGMNKSTVKNIITEKGGIVEISKSGNFSITKLNMGTKKPDVVITKFVNDKLFEIVVVFMVAQEAKTQDVFDDIKSIIETKYGKGNSYRTFKGIYSDGDGYEMQAVRTGNATISTYWLNFKDENAIGLEISNTDNFMLVRLDYQDGKLLDIASKQEDAKNNVEF